MQKTILVIDDEPAIRSFLQEILEDSGYGVKPACNGQEGLQWAGNNRPDLILLDIHLPDIDGIGVLEALNSLGYNGPVILMSADVVSGKISRGLKLGAFAFIRKPFANHILLETIEGALDGMGPGPIKNRPPSDCRTKTASRC
jgi:DNA-binding response OmpR family regulator